MGDTIRVTTVRFTDTGKKYINTKTSKSAEDRGWVQNRMSGREKRFLLEERMYEVCADDVHNFPRIHTSVHQGYHGQHVGERQGPAVPRSWAHSLAFGQVTPMLTRSSNVSTIVQYML